MSLVEQSVNQTPVRLSVPDLGPEVEGLVPADGVYAGWLTRLDLPDDGETADRVLPAAVSIGTNPTFAGHERRVEGYVLDRTDLARLLDNDHRPGQRGSRARYLGRVRRAVDHALVPPEKARDRAHLCAGFLDDLLPFLDFCAQESLQLFRRRALDLHAMDQQSILQLGIRQRLPGLGV